MSMIIRFTKVSDSSGSLSVRWDPPIQTTYELRFRHREAS